LLGIKKRIKNNDIFSSASVLKLNKLNILKLFLYYSANVCQAKHFDIEIVESVYKKNEEKMQEKIIF
jgi:hypothetical protein